MKIANNKTNVNQKDIKHAMPGKIYSGARIENVINIKHVKFNGR